jgi:hypothetical protein
MGGYSVRQAIAEALTDEFANGVIAAAVRQAVGEVDVQKLASVLAKEMMRATTRGVVAVLEDAMITLLVQMRGGKDYEADNVKQRRRDEVRAQLFGGSEPPVSSCVAVGEVRE